MIDETLNPSVEKSTAENSVENSEKLNVNDSEVNPAVEEAAAVAAAVVAAGDIVGSAAGESAAAMEEPAQEEMRGAVISEEELKSLPPKSLKEIVQTLRNLVYNGAIMEFKRQSEYN